MLELTLSYASLLHSPHPLAYQRTPLRDLTNRGGPDFAK